MPADRLRRIPPPEAPPQRAREPLPRVRPNPFTLEHGGLDRRKGLLGRSRVGALAATYTLVGIAVLLTALLFAAVANLGSDTAAPPQLAAVPQGQEGLQVIRADPLERAQVHAYLSVPGRLGVNVPAAEGALVVGNAVPLGASGLVEAGDTLRVCTFSPVPAVQLTLVDATRGTIVGSHLFLEPPACPALPAASPVTG